MCSHLGLGLSLRLGLCLSLRLRLGLGGDPFLLLPLLLRGAPLLGEAGLFGKALLLCDTSLLSEPCLFLLPLDLRYAGLLLRCALRCTCVKYFLCEYIGGYFE